MTIRPGLPATAAAGTAVLAVLRAVHVIAWPWWLVTAPLWALAALVAVLFAGILVTAAIGNIHGGRERRRAHAGL